MKSRALAFSAFAIVFSSMVAVAAPNCGQCNWQVDGTYFQICVNDDGSRHCYKATDSSGSNPKEVSCAS